MNWFGSGFITQIIYATAIGGNEQSLDLLTENNEVILTEDNLPIEIEH